MDKDKNMPSNVIVDVLIKYRSKKELCEIATKAEL